MHKLFVNFSVSFVSCFLFFWNSASGQEIFDAQRRTEGLTDFQAKLISEKVVLFPENTQLAIAVIRDGRAVYYGVERRNDTLRTISNSNRTFEIGSISKVFTSTLLADLVLRGKLRLDEPVNSHLPMMNKSNPVITFSQLANHTSGLPRLPSNLNLFLVDQGNPYKDYGPEKLEEFLAGEITLADPPGSKYAYSNLGAGLLGYVLTLIEGSTYEELLQNRIFIPLRMTSTTTVRSRVEDRLVKGRNYEGKEVPNWDLNVLAGAGGIISTVEDLAKFGVAQFDPLNGVFALTRKPTFSINERGDIGLGWHLIHEVQDKAWVWHNGGTGGYTSCMVLDTGNRNGVIILSNVSAFNQQMRNIDKLAFELITSLIDEK